MKAHILFTIFASILILGTTSCSKSGNRDRVLTSSAFATDDGGFIPDPRGGGDQGSATPTTGSPPPAQGSGNTTSGGTGVSNPAGNTGTQTGNTSSSGNPNGGTASINQNGNPASGGTASNTTGGTGSGAPQSNPSDGGTITPPHSGGESGSTSGNSGGSGSTAGNSGGGTGNPPTNGGSNPSNPGNGTNAGNGTNGSGSGSTGGSTSQPPTDGGTVATGTPLKVVFGRACSVLRSQWTDFRFVEDARNPILVFEATPPARANLPASTLLQLSSTRLQNLDLTQSTWTTTLSLSVEQLKQKDPQNWKNYRITPKVCEDPQNTGKCASTCATTTVSKSCPVGNLLNAVEVPFMAGKIPTTLLLDIWSNRFSATQLTQLAKVKTTPGKDPYLVAGRCDVRYSPLVLDLSGRGFRFSDPRSSGVQFDLEDNGEAVYTGWLNRRSNALLVKDSNSDGKITSGAELFGSATRIQDGSRAANGFEALKQYDANGDGLITPQDPVWDSLQLWFDENRDGVTDPGELRPLDAYALASIHLGYVNLEEKDAYGNETRQRSTYERWIDGNLQTLLIIDVWFNTLAE